LQNASDANAERVDFLLDHTTHGTEKIFSPLLAEFQDPAIYVHNSGQFSKEDLENIRNLGNSKKRKSRRTIGKFGLGFNVCYNVTDMPKTVQIWECKGAGKYP
jgi:sacsin